jgi:hypothetical protein
MNDHPAEAHTHHGHGPSELLASEHTEIEQLMEAVETARGEVKAAAFDQLRSYLAVHPAAELAGLRALTTPHG